MSPQRTARREMGAGSGANAAEGPAKLLDDADLAILRILQQRADASAVEIAAAIGLSQPSTWRRINRLERARVIRNRVILLDPDALGLRLCVHAEVVLSRHDSHSLADFAQSVRSVPEVTECYAIAGDRDFLLKVLVEDIASYDRLLGSRLRKLPGVTSIVSHVTLWTVKHSTQLPI